MGEPPLESGVNGSWKGFKERVEYQLWATEELR